MTTATLPASTGVVSTYGYDNADLLTSISHDRGGTTLASVAYTLDDVGNRTQRVDQQGTHRYAYETLIRIKSLSGQFLEQFLSIHPTSWLRTCVGDKQAITSALYPLYSETRGLSVRWVRGSRMRDREGLFSEFAAALQFQWYTGKSWDAFVDSFRDLSWIPYACTAGAVIVFDAELTLVDSEPEEFHRFVSCLSWLALAMTSETQWTFPDVRPPTPFHVMFHTSSNAGLSLLKARLANTVVGDAGPVVPLDADD